MQIPLFQYSAKSRARKTDPDTSKAAASEIADKITMLQAEVMEFAQFRTPFGFTDWELCNHFSNHGSTYRTRRAELTAKGKIKDSGHRRTLPSGRKAIVWVVNE